MSEASYFHGGVPGLAVGDWVLPPDETGVDTLANWGMRGLCRTDRVYLGDHPTVALIYASLWHEGIGGLYEVEPDGPLEPDEDWSGRPGASVCARRARVTNVIPISEDTKLADGKTLAALREALILDGLGVRRASGKIGRNEPCPCGSGKKFKRCCGV